MVTQKHFPKLHFLWTQELELPKMEIFRRCLEIAGKARRAFAVLGKHKRNVEQT